MTEPTPNPAPEPAAQPTEGDPKPQLSVEELQAKLDQATAEARKWETRSKENHAAAKALEDQRKAAMTDNERAVAEAEERGRTAAVTQYGQRLARTEFIAEAAKRNPGFDASAILDDLNLARYIGEDGEPDSKAIAKAAQRLIPEASSGAPQPPSFDGGTRQAAPSSASMSDLIRAAAGRA